MTDKPKEITVEKWLADEVMLMSKFVKFMSIAEPSMVMTKGDWHEQYEAWVNNQIEDEYDG